jgi:hypothetical protein
MSTVRKPDAQSAFEARCTPATSFNNGYSQLTPSALRSLLEDSWAEDVEKRRRTFFQFAMHSLRGLA